MKKYSKYPIIFLVFIIAFICGTIPATAQEETPEQSPAAVEVQPPQKAEILFIKTYNRKAVIKLKKLEEADSYEIFMSKKKNGKFKKAGETASAKFTVKKLKNKRKKYYFKARAYKTVDGKKRYGEFSDVKSARVYKYRKAALKGSVMSEAKWASDKLGSVKKGKYVKIIKKRGNWLETEYKGEKGYIYNRVIKNKSNLSRGSVNKNNYKLYLDDVIFENGRDIKACYDYVRRNMTYANSYAHSNIGNVAGLINHEDEFTAEAIKKKRGNCVNYTTLLKNLLERAGHKTYYAYSHSTRYSVNVHAWCVTETDKGFRHIDAKRGFYLLTDSQLKTDPRSRDLREIEDTFPPCK